MHFMPISGKHDFSLSKCVKASTRRYDLLNLEGGRGFSSGASPPPKAARGILPQVGVTSIDQD